MKLPDFDRADIQAAKREVVRLGHAQGYIDEADIMSVLPTQYMLADELETFLFTLEMMEIEVRLADGSTYQDAGRLTLATATRAANDEGDS